MCRAHVAFGTSPTPVATVSVVFRVVSVSQPLHDGVETGVGSGDVLHDPHCTVSLLEGVRSFDVVAVPVFVLLLLVAGVWVVDRVFKVVACWTLK